MCGARAAVAQGPTPEQLFQEAQQAQQRGDYAVAVDKYQELLRAYPDIVAARANLGVALVSLGRFDEAIKQYRVALEQVPGNHDLRLNLALAYYKGGKFPEASELFQSLLGEDSGNTRIATLLGNCYLHLGRDAEAISLLTPFERSDPQNLDIAWALGSALIRTGQTEEGLKRVDRVAQDGHSAEAYMVAAQSYLKLNRMVTARERFDEAMHLDARLPGLYTVGGMIMENSGDSEGAVSAFRKALEMHPNDFEAQLHLGGVLFADRQLDEAKQHVDRALALDTTSSVARYMLARIERAQGQTNAALAELEKVTRGNPDWLQPHVELAALYYQLKRPEDGARERKIVDRLTAEEQQHKAAQGIVTPTLPSR